MRLTALLLLFLTGLAAPRSSAAPANEKRIEALFRQHEGEMMALSADGRYLAHTLHRGDELLIIVTDLEQGVVTTRISADEDRPILHSKEKRPARLRFMEWADGRRLVFAPEVEYLPPPVSVPVTSLQLDRSNEAIGPFSVVAPLEMVIIAPIMAVDADGRNPRTLADAKTFQTLYDTSAPDLSAPRAMRRTPIVLGFMAGDRAHLIVEVQGLVTRSFSRPTQVYKVNVHTGKTTELHSEEGSARLDYDQRANPRLSLETTNRYQQSFLVRPVAGGRWQKLAPPTGSFETTPQNYYEERAIPLGFAVDPDVLLYATNVGHNTFGIYGLNLKTRTRAPLSLEHPTIDLVSPDATTASANLVLDPHRRTLAGVRAPGSRPFTVWVDADLADVQRAVAEKFPGRSVQLRDWDAARARFLVDVTGGAEPGRVFVFQREENLITELMRHARWLPTSELHDTEYFEFAGEDGAMLSGFLTRPRTPRQTPAPLLIWLAPGLPATPQREFDAQAHVLADMGLYVCRLNQRGVIGHGARVRDAFRRDPDGATTTDAVAAIEWIAAHDRIDRRRVAIAGEGVGAYHALRATQLRPDMFRCVVAFEPVTSLRALVQPSAEPGSPPPALSIDAFVALNNAGIDSEVWGNSAPNGSDVPTFSQAAKRHYLEGRGAKLAQFSVTAHPEALKAPVFVLRRVDRQSRTDAVIDAGVAQLRGQLARRSVPCVDIEVNADFAAGAPAARTRVYRALEEFFNLHLYNYDVKIGPAREVK